MTQSLIERALYRALAEILPSIVESLRDQLEEATPRHLAALEAEALPVATEDAPPAPAALPPAAVAEQTTRLATATGRAPLSRPATETTRQEAQRLYENTPLSLAEIARQLKITPYGPQRVSNWRTRYQWVKAGSPAAPVAQEAPAAVVDAPAQHEPAAASPPPPPAPVVAKKAEPDTTFTTPKMVRSWLVDRLRAGGLGPLAAQDKVAAMTHDEALQQANLRRAAQKQPPFAFVGTK